MTDKNKYFDISMRDDKYEKKTKIDLKSAWKLIKENEFKGSIVNFEGDAVSTGNKLKSHQKVTPMREQEDDEVEDTPEPEVVGDEEIQTDDIVDTEVEDTPEQEVIGDEEVSAEEPDAKVEEANAKTQEFISKSLSTLPSDVELTPTNGVFKGDVQDEHLGAFTVVVYPNDVYASIHDAATAVEPLGNAGPESPDIDTMDGEEVPVEEPIDGEEEVVSDESPLDVEDGEEVVPDETPEEEPVEDEELAEEDMIDYEVEDEEDEQGLYESRDPVNPGKKDWKRFLESRYNK